MIDSPSPDNPETKGEGNMPDVYSFDKFVRAYVESRMPKSLRRNLGISDIIQSVLCAAAGRMPQFRGSNEMELRGWLLRIAERKILDGLRRYRKRPCPPRLHNQFLVAGNEPVEERTPCSQVAKVEEARLLLSAISFLSPDIQQILLMRHNQSKTFEQIAKELNMPVTTCRRRWLEGLQQIETQLGDVLR